ncbi:MAG: FHA domain-containing protein [Rhodoferax sp.]|uniref:FHA domain-containing protein n=1 Tax=Rhodoferax sp. TaxID=50421 RepID=UPI00262BE65A|nr:FHA domain-containing protein [Rhodoferax sp.]MDD2880578.1 FHA domain-containing protein [Rhodoferax sp.]
MPKIIVMMDGVLIKEVELTKERTTLGRRPYNDIVIENLAVSGEHAAFHMHATEVAIEDLNSTNGTFVNGKAVRKQVLHHGDILEVGKYRIQFESDAAFDKTMVVAPQRADVVAPYAREPDPVGAIKVLSGPAAGREMPLTKVVTTVGKPGVSIAAITRRQHHFVVHHVEGSEYPLLNGVALAGDPVVLKDGDRIVLAGTEMLFFQS